MNTEVNVPVAPPAFSQAPPGKAWRAWARLPGEVLNGCDHDDSWRWWLLLTDGRVLVFRLRGISPDDALANSLAEVLAPDLRGDVLETALTVGWAGLLYGAPVSPIFCTNPASPAFGHALAFHACLDSELVVLLAGMAGQYAFWASARNYSRMVTHVRYGERLQALRRYPLLVAPILLTHQRWPNLSDSKRFRWRAHDDAVVAAIDEGRDLSGALARHYGISRGLVGSPFCAQARSVSGCRTLVEFLQFLDGIPAHRRPESGSEVDRYIHHLPAFWALFDGFWLESAVVFREGFGLVWSRLERRFETNRRSLNAVLMDAADYLRALSRWLVAVHGRRLAPARIATLWVRQRSLAGLLDASLRWHRWMPPTSDRGSLPDRIQAILGEWCEREWSARELTRWEDLVEDGRTQRHCIADYWRECVQEGHRVFSVRKGVASGAMSTALFVLEGEEDVDPRYVLKQIRGNANADVDEVTEAFAKRLEVPLNSPDRLQARRAARCQEMSMVKIEGPGARPLPRLDPGSISVLRALLDLPSAAPEAFDSLLPLAGYAHVFNAAHEESFTIGQALALVREPANQADTLAVRVDFDGRKIGYVPRPENARIARLLDEGGSLVAKIGDFRAHAPVWQRVWIKIERC